MQAFRINKGRISSVDNNKQEPFINSRTGNHKKNVQSE